MHKRRRILIKDITEEHIGRKVIWINAGETCEGEIRLNTSGRTKIVENLQYGMKLMHFLIELSKILKMKIFIT